MSLAGLGLTVWTFTRIGYLVFLLTSTVYIPQQ